MKTNQRKTLTVRVTVDREWFHWAGDKRVKEQLVGLVYDNLRRLDIADKESICTAKVVMEEEDDA